MEQNYHNIDEHLRSVIDNAPFPIGVYVGHELRILLANDAIKQAFGKGDDVIGKCYPEILPELATQKIFEQLRGVLTSGEAFHAHNQRVDIVKDGKLKPHYFNYSFTPLRDKNDVVFAVMNTGADVTDLTLAHQHSKKYDERLKLAVSAAELGTYETNLSTEAIKYSQRFADIFGLDANATRQDVIDRIHPDDRKLRVEAHERAFQGDGNFSYEARLVKSGKTTWIRVRGKILRDDDDPILLGIVQDITEQKEYDRKLHELVNRKTAQLKRSNEDLLHFAHVVSHDLKEPVRKYQFFTSLLKTELGDDCSDKVKGYIQKLAGSSERMMNLIDGILTYASLASADKPVSKVDLAKIISDLDQDLEFAHRKKRRAALSRGSFLLSKARQCCFNSFFTI